MKKKLMLIIALSFCGALVYAATRYKNNITEKKATINKKEAEKTLVQQPIDVTVDEDAKRKETVALVKRAVEFMDKNSLENACAQFSHTKDFIEGELYIFVFDVSGTVLAHGEQESLIWQDLSKRVDIFGTPIFKEIAQAGSAERGTHWATYEWRGATKKSYIQIVEKNGKSYFIGAGYYSHSKKDAVVNLVKGAVALTKQVLGEGNPIIQAFSDLSYPLGKFVYGDLYLYALDFNGKIMAQGDRPELIGTNSIDYKDATGKLVNQVIINKLKETTDGVWVEYISKRAKKIAYAEKVKDANGAEYFIACGYYPDADRQQAVDLVKKGYVYMKQNGLSAAVEEFTNKTIETFRYGDLALFVLDMKGVCKAHGDSPELIGKNLYNIVDESGRPYIREMIEKANKDGSGWINAKINKAFASIYFEKIDLGVKSYVIACKLYPISKAETMDLLVKSAVSYLKAKDRKKAFAAFAKDGGEFINGDLGVFVLDNTGLCYAWQDEFQFIWENLLGWKDDDGKPYIKLFINSVTRGETKVTYRLNKRQVIAEVAPLEKDGIKYVIGSYFYK